MAKTLEQKLESVQAAIERIEAYGATRGFSNRQVIEAQLATLYAREAKLEEQIAAAGNAGTASAVTYARRMRPS